MFRFEQPEVFWALLLLAFMAALFVLKKRRLGKNLSWPRLFLPLVGFLLCIIGLARPQWGRMVVSQRATKTNVLLAVDISKSMTALDVMPTRLGFTISFLEKLVQRTRGVRFGVFPFAQDGYLLLPFTSDVAAILDMLQPLSPNIMTDQGTDFTQVLESMLKQILRMEELAKEKMQDWPSAQVVFISDGESHTELKSSILSEFASRKISIHTVFVGTPQGAMIVLDNQERVKTEGTPKYLKEMSRVTGGVSTTGQYDQVYRLVDAIAARAKYGALTASFKLEREFFPYFLALALLCFILDFLLGGWEFAFQRTIWILFFLPVTAYGDEVSATTHFNEGVKAAESDPKTALERFQDALNETQQLDLKKKALFNQGNVLLKLGEMKQALYSYQQAMDIKATDPKFQKESNQKISDNISLTYQLLKQLKKMQQQQGESKDNEPSEGAEDRKGPQKDYESQQFSEKEKKKMYDLLADEEMQTIMKIQQQRNQIKGRNYTEKPW